MFLGRSHQSCHVTQQTYPLSTYHNWLIPCTTVNRDTVRIDGIVPLAQISALNASYSAYWTISKSKYYHYWSIPHPVM